MTVQPMTQLTVIQQEELQMTAQQVMISLTGMEHLMAMMTELPMVEQVTETLLMMTELPQMTITSLTDKERQITPQRTDREMKEKLKLLKEKKVWW